MGFLSPSVCGFFSHLLLPGGEEIWSLGRKVSVVFLPHHSVIFNKWLPFTPRGFTVLLQ